MHSSSVSEFYDQIAERYHLIYPDWDASIRRQAGHLNSVIREFFPSTSRILDVSCGIGTQALGLSEIGYQIVASDISPASCERARREADSRGLSIDIRVGDMRSISSDHKDIDLIIACDNALPHLLDRSEILNTFQGFHSHLPNGGGCIISVRDYATIDFSEDRLVPYGIRTDGSKRWLLFQAWHPDSPFYDLDLYFVEDTGGTRCDTFVSRSRYLAISISDLMDLMREAGFSEVVRLDERYFQPIILGKKNTAEQGAAANP